MIPITNAITTYTLKLPSTGKVIEYRPFIEKERKQMLMAIESHNKNDTLAAIKNIAKSCCLNGIDLNTITLFDIEYIFIHLRAKSIGEIVKLNFQCNNVVDNKSCNNIMHPEVDITTTVVEGLKEDLKIKFTPKFGVKMKYPTLAVFDNISDVEESDYTYKLIASCIDYIWDGENIYYTKDYPFEDALDFIMKLTHNQYIKLEEFFLDIPTVKKTFNHICPKCKYEHTSTIEGYQSFFI